MGIKENIRLLREKYNLSQKDLALIAGVSDKAVSTWENGSKEPRMGAIQRIADHFGLKKSNIIEDDGLLGIPSYYTNPETAALAQEIHDNPDLRILMDASRDLSPEDVKFVAEMVQRMKKKERGEDD